MGSLNTKPTSNWYTPLRDRNDDLRRDYWLYLRNALDDAFSVYDAAKGKLTADQRTTLAGKRIAIKHVFDDLLICYAKESTAHMSAIRASIAADMASDEARRAAIRRQEEAPPMESEAGSWNWLDNGAETIAPKARKAS